MIKNCTHCGGTHIGSGLCPYLGDDPQGHIAAHKAKTMTNSPEDDELLRIVNEARYGKVGLIWNTIINNGSQPKKVSLSGLCKLIDPIIAEAQPIYDWPTERIVKALLDHLGIEYHD